MKRLLSLFGGIGALLVVFLATTGQVANPVIFLGEAMVGFPASAIPFVNGNVIGGSADLTWNGTTIGLTEAHGLSFSGPSNPITVTGSDEGFGDTSVVFDNAVDNYLVMTFNQYTDWYFPPAGTALTVYRTDVHDPWLIMLDLDPGSFRLISNDTVDTNENGIDLLIQTGSAIAGVGGSIRMLAGASNSGTAGSLSLASGATTTGSLGSVSIAVGGTPVVGAGDIDIRTNPLGGSSGHVVMQSNLSIDADGAATLGHYTTNGFVKTSGGTGALSIDTNTYLTAAVTSVGLSSPGVLYTVSGSPVTTTGTLALNLINQSANRILAGPASGGAAAPAFRALVSADLPAGVGTVTSIATTSPISGGTISGTGTISLLVNVDHAFTAAQSITLAPASNTSADGLILTDTTAASASNQQFSPRLRLTGQGWKTTATAASQNTDWIIENQPVQGTANPTTNLVISSQVNAGGYTARATLTSGGIFTIGTLRLDTGGLTTYTLQSGNSASMRVLNAAGTAWATFTALAIGLDPAGAVKWGASNAEGTWDTFLQRDGAANTLALRNAANAQTFRWYASYTDASNYTRGAVTAATGAPGSVTLSAESAGTGSANIDLVFTPKGTGNVSLPGGTLLKTAAALTDGSGASAGTLTNAPAVGNPTKWIPINDNGTTRYIPAW